MTLAHTLRTRPWGIGATIFAMGNAKVGVFGLILDAVNCLDGVSNVCEVDKCTIPDENLSAWNVETNNC
jgi:hypothetical protein